MSQRLQSSYILSTKTIASPTEIFCTVAVMHELISQHQATFGSNVWKLQHMGPCGHGCRCTIGRLYMYGVIVLSLLSIALKSRVVSTVNVEGASDEEGNGEELSVYRDTQ